MASHFAHYLDLLKLPYQQWSRSQNDTMQLQQLLSESTHVLILINDNAIERFAREHIYAQYSHLHLIHFSGCRTITNIHGAHPLQTFAVNKQYSLEDYQSIPFVLETTAPEFSALLPGLNNPNYRIDPSDKAYYHAIGVLANNVGALLWQKFYTEMTQRFKLKPQDLHPILKQTFTNIQADPMNALTGPIARGDTQTLEKNVQGLDNDPYQTILQAVKELNL